MSKGFKAQPHPALPAGAETLVLTLPGVIFTAINDTAQISGVVTLATAALVAVDVNYTINLYRDFGTGAQTLLATVTATSLLDAVTALLGPSNFTVSVVFTDVPPAGTHSYTLTVTPAVLLGVGVTSTANYRALSAVVAT